MAEMMMGDKREVRKLLNDGSKTAPSFIAYEPLPSRDLHLAHSHWSGQYKPPPRDTSAVPEPWEHTTATMLCHNDHDPIGLRLRSDHYLKPCLLSTRGMCHPSNIC